MNSRCKGYRVCGVPQCGNSTKETPNKLFVYVPLKPAIRNEWLARANWNRPGVKASYFCEDHFDMPNDMINYMEYRLMGKVPTIRMKPGTMPTRFDCQKTGKKKKPINLKNLVLPNIRVSKNIFKQSITEDLSFSDHTSVPQAGFAVFIKEEPPEEMQNEDYCVRESDTLETAAKGEAVEPESLQNTEAIMEPADDGSKSTIREIEIEASCVKMEPADEYDSPNVIMEALELGPEELTSRNIAKKELRDIPDNSMCRVPTPIPAGHAVITEKDPNMSSDAESDVTVTSNNMGTCASDFLSISLKEVSPTENMYTCPQPPDFEEVDLNISNPQDFLYESAKRRLFAIEGYIGCEEKVDKEKISQFFVSKIAEEEIVKSKGPKRMGRKFICGVCEKHFSSKQSLQSHKRKHSLPDPYYCQICETQFKNLSAYVDHKSTHVKEKRYTCKICEKEFTVFEKYKEHNVHVHTRVRKFPCDICKQKFHYIKHLEKHKRTVHARKSKS